MKDLIHFKIHGVCYLLEGEVEYPSCGGQSAYLRKTAVTGNKCLFYKAFNFFLLLFSSSQDRDMTPKKKLNCFCH